MPKATISNDTEHFLLKTMPPVDDQEGGFVELRRMTHGQKLRKDAEALRMTMKLNGGSTDDAEVTMALANAESTYIEFAACIVRHNLTDENDKPLDMKKREDVDKLDPRVGAEIAFLIGQMNDFADSIYKPSVDAKGKALPR